MHKLLKKVTCLIQTLILLILSLTSTEAEQIENEPFGSFLIEHLKFQYELPFSMINDVEMTQDGYLWVCNYDGLYRWDGESFRFFNKYDSPSLRSGTLAVKEDAAENLWIACNGHAITQYQDGKFKQWSTEDGLDFSNYHELYLDQNGMLMLVGKTGLQSIQENQVVDYPIEGFQNLPIFTLQFTSDGSCYLITEDSKIFKTNIKNGQFSPLQEISAPRISQLQISTVTEGLNNSLLIGTYEKQLFKLSSSNLLKEIPHQEYDINSAVLDIRYDHSGVLWILQRSGLVKKTATQCDFYPTPIGSNAAIYGDLLFTHDNTVIAAGRDSGLFCFRKSKSSFMTEDQGLEGYFINAVFKDKNGTLWIASENGIQTYKDGKLESFRNDLFAGHSIRDVFIDSQNRMWVCFLTNKLICINRENGSIWQSAPDIGTSRFRTTAEDHNGIIWVATTNGVYTFEKKGLPTTFDKHLLLRQTALSLFVDKNNTVWVGTADDGLHRIRDNITEKVTTEPEDSNTVFAGHQDEEGRLIFGTTKGILVVDPSDKRQYLSFGDDEDTIFSCIDDEMGNFWFGCIHSIKSVKKSDFYDYLKGTIEKVPFENFDNTNALPVKDLKGNSRTTLDDDGRIWFPLKGGISIISPPKIRPKFSIPIVYIQSIEKDDTEKIDISTKAPKPIQIEAHVKSIRISYVGISYQTKGELLYKIRLKGYEEWKETNRIEAVYSNLSPKNYAFEVIARSGDGVWSKEPQTLHLQILPAFYETKTFIALGILLGVLFLALLYRTRVKYLRHQRLILEKTVEQRTQELEKVSNDLYESVSALSEANENKNQILSMAAHDLKNAASGVVFAAETLESSYDNNSQQLDKAMSLSMIKMIGTSGNQILATIMTLLEKGEQEVGKKKLKLEERSFNSLIESVISLNRSRAEAKNQHISFTPNNDEHCVFDPLQMRMAIDNYVNNAIKYSPFGTEITINLTQEKHGHHSFIKIEVRDQGPGLSKEDRRKAFRKYTTLSAKPTGGEDSSGVGLSIVKDIVEAHEGWVGVYSKPNEGASFYLMIPMDPKRTSDEA